MIQPLPRLRNSPGHLKRLDFMSLQKSSGYFVKLCIEGVKCLSIGVKQLGVK